MLWAPLADEMVAVAKAAPPPKVYCPFRAVPKYVVSRFARNSPPNLNECFPRVHAKLCRPVNRFPSDAVTDPPAASNASYRPSAKISDGSVWSGVGKCGVVRVKLSDDSEVKLGDEVRVHVSAAFRWWSM